MLPGIVAGQTRVSGGGGTLWTPLNMTTVPQIYLDAQDSVVTDVSGFASAISNLGALGVDGDFSQATAANRPAILAAELNGNRVLSFDGVDDRLQTSAAAAKDLHRAVETAFSFTVYKKRLSSAVFRVVFQTTIGTSSGSRFAQSINNVAGNKPLVQGRALDGDTASSAVAITGVEGQYVMVLCAFNVVSRWGRVYVDGDLLVENTTMIAASRTTTSDTTAQDNLTLGSFSSGLSAADIDIAALVSAGYATGATLSTGDIDKLFGWAAHKYGLTASLPVGHPYKSAAPTI